MCYTVILCIGNISFSGLGRCDIVKRNTYLVFLPFSGTDLLKPLEFPKW